jgi:cation diffusion facilitator CzcD-associated flavoprotein CzcO
MKIAIIGAGVAGLCTAKVLDRLGHEIAVYDKTPDVGGVWSATRRYPGLSTQSPRDTYAFSDFPMPKDFPEWPSGAQVQSYLAAYATHFGVNRLLRLNTEVISADTEGAGWSVAARRVGGDGSGNAAVREHFDHLIVANGVFCDPLVPEYDGVEDFVAAGGQLRPGNDLHDADEARDRRVLVIGYGKSACDVAVAIGKVAASTDVVARQMLWKVPRKVGGLLNFKYLLLTRLGEALFRYRTLRGFERFLHGPGNPIRRNMLSSVGSVSTRQFRLRELDLLPGGAYSDIVRNAIGLSTEGFYEGVAAKVITVHRDATVKRLLEKDGAPYAELADGTLLPADLILCATGFRQRIPFFSEPVQAQLRDERGNFMLYRQIHPVDVANLSFAGYNSSFFSPLSAEMAAIWIAAKLAGQLELPERPQLRRRIEEQLAFLDDAVGGHHCCGTKIIPFSLHNIDEILDDLDLNLGALRRATQWLAPIDPGAYCHIIDKLQHRLGDRASETSAVAVP